ncbi:hypothetical protein ABVT39_006936 [Epinephelus coioides]
MQRRRKKREPSGEHDPVKAHQTCSCNVSCRSLCRNVTSGSYTVALRYGSMTRSLKELVLQVVLSLRSRLSASVSMMSFKELQSKLKQMIGDMMNLTFLLVPCVNLAPVSRHTFTDSDRRSAPCRTPPHVPSSMFLYCQHTLCFNGGGNLTAGTDAVSHPDGEIRGSRHLIRATADVSTAVSNRQPAAGALLLTFDPPAAPAAESTVQTLKNSKSHHRNDFSLRSKPEFSLTERFNYVLCPLNKPAVGTVINYGQSEVEFGVVNDGLYAARVSLKRSCN